MMFFPSVHRKSWRQHSATVNPAALHGLALAFRASAGCLLDAPIDKPTRLPAHGTTRISDISKERVQQLTYSIRKHLTPVGGSLTLAPLGKQRARGSSMLILDSITHHGLAWCWPVVCAVHLTGAQQKSQLLATIQEIVNREAARKPYPKRPA